MPLSSVLSYAAAYFSLIVAVGVLVRDRHSLVHRIFAAGLLVFAAEEVLRGLSYGAVLPADVLYWQKRLLAVTALVPVVWLAFSLAYARVDSARYLSRAKVLLLAFGVLPVLLVLRDGEIRARAGVGGMRLGEVAFALRLEGRQLRLVSRR